MECEKAIQQMAEVGERTTMTNSNANGVQHSKRIVDSDVSSATSSL
jgi:hypothetical protein